MSFDFFTEHQIHILLRIVTVIGLFLGLLAFIAFLSKRGAARQEKPNDSERRGQKEIPAKDGWRNKPKRKKGRR
jgi:hypothetical protein